MIQFTNALLLATVMETLLMPVKKFVDAMTLLPFHRPLIRTAAPPSGTWYCFQVDLDKTVEGCSGAKEVSHSVLATGFSESCLFHPGGIDASGSDNWDYQTCDNTAATGLKFDFGHNGITSGNTYSVTYCFDVSCEAAPAGQGSVDWVIKAGNDRCEIQVTEGAIPNCGVSNDLCSPSCPADDGDERGGNGGGNGGGNNKAVNDPSPGICYRYWWIF